MATVDDARLGRSMAVATGQRITRRAENVIDRMLGRTLSLEDLSHSVTLATDEPMGRYDELAEVRLARPVDLSNTRSLEQYGFNPTFHKQSVSDDGDLVLHIEGEYHGETLGLVISYPLADAGGEP